MWCEARRCEKEAQSRLKDATKRAQRRKKFYDNVKKEPKEFLHIQGLKATIHTDIKISSAADEGNILRRWQGDPTVTIDRFDARSLIDYITEPNKIVELSNLEEKQEMIFDYERYRLLVLFDFKHISEKSILTEIEEKESWLDQPEENKTDQIMKKQENQSQGLNFIYKDSEVVGGEDEEFDSDNVEGDGTEQKFNSATFSCSAEDQKLANSIGEAYGVKNGHFVALVRADEIAQKEAEELERIEVEMKLQSGPEGSMARQVLRRQADMIIRRRQSNEATLKLSHLRRKEEGRPLVESSSSGEESAPKKEFILSFGGEDEKTSRAKENRKGRSSRWDRRSRSPGRRRSRSTSRSRRRESPRRGYRDRCRRSSTPRRRRSRSTSRRHRRESPKRDEQDRPLFSLCDKKPSPVHVSSDSGGEDALLEIRSSMSESEKERIEIENRKRRVKRTKRMVKAKQNVSGGKERRDGGEVVQKTVVEKVKKIMQKSLRKTLEEMKEEEDERKREHRNEQRAREELNFLGEQERRERDRERKRQERERRDRSSSQDSARHRKRPRH